MTSEYRHTPVLLAECLEYSNLKPQHTFVDATLGGAGHSFEAAKLIGSGGTLIGIDQDEVALAAARLKLGTLPDDVRPRLELVRGNFGNMDEALLSTEVPGVDAVLFDLGVSSVQIDTPSRGFSFKENGPLDMRMDPGKQTLTAAEIINTYTAADLTRIIRTYSDEKWASRIADFAVRARQNAPIETSEQLVDIIKAAIPASARRAGGHPAKRTFQALRIEVNGELDVLRSGLDAAIRWLNPGGRLVVISYHSLEDRIVKETFAKFANRCTCPPDLPACMCGKQPILDIVTRKPVLPTAEEIERNARARSAKLRVAQNRYAKNVPLTQAGAICTARDLYMQSKHRKGVGHGRSTSVFVLSRARTRTQPARAHQRRSGPRHPHADPHASVERRVLGEGGGGRAAGGVACGIRAHRAHVRDDLHDDAVEPADQPDQRRPLFGRRAGSVPEHAVQSDEGEAAGGQAGHGRPRDHGGHHSG